MKVLKVLALILLGLLLVLSLIIFGPMLTVNQTALNPGFIASQVDKLDIAEIAEEIIIEEVPPEAVEFMGESLNEALYDTVADLEPWIKQQAREATYVFYDYLEGRSQDLNLSISLETVKETLRENLLAAILASPPPELAGFPPAEIEQEFNEQYSEIDEVIPSTLEVDETTFDAEAMEQIEQAKQYVGYFNLAFIMLIAFSLLLILLIILVYRTVRGSTRHIGITFLGCGAVSLAAAIIGKSFANDQLAKLEDVPATIQTWLPQLVSDTLSPLMIYGIALAVAGAALVVVSILYKRNEYSY